MIRPQKMRHSFLGVKVHGLSFEAGVQVRGVCDGVDGTDVYFSVYIGMASAGTVGKYWIQFLTRAFLSL